MNGPLDTILDLIADVGFRCFWRVFAGVVLGLGVTYALLKLFEMDVHQVWPYVIGGIVGLVYGIRWQAGQSY